VICALQWPASSIPRRSPPTRSIFWAWPLEPVVEDLSAHIEILEPRRTATVVPLSFRSGSRTLRGRPMRTCAGFSAAISTGLLKKISFRANRFGKPELADEASSLNFRPEPYPKHCRSGGGPPDYQWRGREEVRPSNRKWRPHISPPANFPT